jgi:S-adenosylhomocysteine hydrolase
MNTALRGFEAYNDEENGQQTVIALIEADEQRVKRFLNVVESTQPQIANVSGVTSEEYIGDVMPVWQAATIGSFTQLNKAIPILQDMRDNLKAVRKTTDATLEEIKGLREEIQPGLGEQLRQMQADIRALKDRAGML